MKRVLYIAIAIHFFVVSLIANSRAVVVQEESVLSCDVPQFFSPDSSRLVSENEGRVKIWDARTFALTRSFDIGRLDPKASGVTHLARDIGISPDGKTLVAAIGLRMTNGYSNSVVQENRQSEGALQFWDVSSGKLLRSINNPHTGAQENFSGPIWFSPDNRIFAVKSSDEVWLWETATGKFLRALPKSSGVSFVFFSPDSTLILGGGTVTYWNSGEEYRTEWYLWDARSGRLLRGIQSGDYTDLRGFSVDGKTLRGFIYTDGAKGLNAIWSTRTGKLVLKAKKKSELGDLSSPDGSVFLRFTGKSASLYSGRNGQLLRTLDYKSDFPPNPQWSFSPDGKTLMERFALETWEHSSVNLWDVTTGKLKKSWHLG